MPLPERFDCASREVRRPHCGVAAQLAGATCAWRVEANQDRETINHFQCGRDGSVPTIGAQRAPPDYYSSFVGIWNLRTRYDGNVASCLGTTYALLETRLVTRGSWD